MDNPEDEVKTIRRAVDTTVKTDDELDSELIAFKWKNPERLFPVMESCQPLTILPGEFEMDMAGNDEEDGPKALFSDVIDELQIYNSKLPPIFSDVNDEVHNKHKKSVGSLRGSLKAETLALDHDHIGKKALALDHHIGKKGKKGKKTKAVRKRSSTRISMKHFEKEFIEEEECIEEEDETDIEPKWTTKHIFETTFDPTTRKITVKTDRLGVFAWAFDRYVHFPFKKWRLEKDKYV